MYTVAYLSRKTNSLYFRKKFSERQVKWYMTSLSTECKTIWWKKNNCDQCKDMYTAITVQVHVNMKPHPPNHAPLHKTMNTFMCCTHCSQSSLCSSQASCIGWCVEISRIEWGLYQLSSPGAQTEGDREAHSQTSHLTKLEKQQNTQQIKTMEHT